MQRPEPHEIDTRAQRIFEYKMPNNVVVRRQASDDYGIDAEIELFVDGRSTGTIFKVQLKGQKSPQVTADGNTISYNFPVHKGTYLIEQIEIPTVFILVDVTNEVVFWCDIHSNQELIDAYLDAKGKAQDSFTFHFYTSNVLPHTLSSLFDTIITSANHIALRRVSRIKPPTYVGYVSNLPDIQNELNHLSQKFEIANAEKLRRFVHEKNYDEAENLIAAILSSPERSNEAKFDALLRTENIFIGKYGGQKGDTSKVEFDISLAEDLTKLAEGIQSKKLRLLAHAFTLSARLFYLVNQDMQLFHNWKVHQVHHDSLGKALDTSETIPFWLQILEAERTRVTRTIMDAYEDATNVISELISEDWLSVPDLVTRIIFSMSIFHLRLNEEGLSENALYVRNLINGLIDFVVAMATRMPQSRERDAIYDRCVIAYEMQITIYADDEENKQQIFERALELVNQIIDEQMKTIASARLTASLNKAKPSTSASDIDWDALANYFRRQAKLIGIDLNLASENISDRNHPKYLDAQIARIIDLGIRDLNPTRILSNCKHLIYAYSGGIGEPAKILGLDSARSKTMGCILHLEHRAIGGYSLDSLYMQFRENHCSKCPHVHPHDPSWQYTTQWHNRRIEDWKEAQSKYRK